jgi:hypothetical protein
MTDVFVSYAKKDIQHASALALFLEAEGFSVWWDRSLEAGDDYQRVIASKLGAARVVVVIWSPNSIESQWVRAEALAAQRDGKLIPVRTGDLDYDRIPPPFNLQHTEALQHSAKLLGVISARMAAPPPTPIVAKQFKYHVLSWAGVVGGAITMLNNLGGFLELANWARWLLAYWHDIAAYAFRAIAGVFSLRFPDDSVGIFTFVVCMACAATGARYLAPATNAARSRKHLVISALLAILALVFLVTIILAFKRSAIIGVVVLFYAYFWILVFLRRENSVKQSVVYAVCLATIYAAFFFLFVEAASRRYGVVRPTSGIYISGLALAVILPAYMLFVASARALLVRLLYVTLVLATLVLLSELSKFRFDFRAPPAAAVSSEIVKSTSHEANVGRVSAAIGVWTD